MMKIAAAQLYMYVAVAQVAIAFLLMASSGIVIKAVRTRLQRNGIGVPRAVSTIGLFRLARQYSQLAKRKGWNPVLGAHGDSLICSRASMLWSAWGQPDLLPCVYVERESIRNHVPYDGGH